MNYANFEIYSCEKFFLENSTFKNALPGVSKLFYVFGDCLTLYCETKRENVLAFLKKLFLNNHCLFKIYLSDKCLAELHATSRTNPTNSFREKWHILSKNGTFEKRIFCSKYKHSLRLASRGFQQRIQCSVFSWFANFYPHNFFEFR